MTPVGALAIAAAGLAAGTINTVVGSGSLVTFPTLVALGYPPVVANVSNTVGLVPGSASGAIGYRRELAGQRGRAVRLGIAAALGGLTGALLLLALPASVFGRVVPVLILLACLLVALQPRLTRLLAARRATATGHSWLLAGLVYLTAIYGGYFGAAQSVILIALLAIFVPDDLQRLNGLKNVLTLVVNGVAALLFLVVAPVAWDAALLIAAGAIVGGQVGAVVGRRLSPIALRGLIIVVGVAVAAKLLLT
ncbi:MAG TPA: sulfite exporter TauE/SafE family protein [Candidatus Limnocylindrales bacterium]